VYLLKKQKETLMLELEHNGYYPLTREHLNLYVPSHAGVYILAVRLANGVHKTFFTSQTENLYKSLRSILHGDSSTLSPEIAEHKERFQCYFTYFVIVKETYRNEVEKMLTHTVDPVLRLKVVNCN
jgi:hypothetical protein